MSFAPLWSLPQPIPPHAVAALLAVILGAVQFALPKGTQAHRITGWMWVLLMAGVAISGLFIHTIRMIGPFSPIHILSFVALGTLAFSINAARRRNIVAHRKSMIALYVLALLVTGAFTLLPGRAMHKVVFGV